MADGLGIYFGAPLDVDVNPTTISGFALNGTTDQLEFLFHSITDQSIARVGIRHNSTTGTSPTYKISLQGIASGIPDGTIKGGGSPASKTFSPSGLSWAAGDWRWLTLDNPYTPSRGEPLALVVAYSSGTVDGSNFTTFGTVCGAVNDKLPVCVQNDAGTRSKQTGLAVYGYGGASTAFGRPCKAITSTAFNSGSSPNEYALRFVLPAGWGNTFRLRGGVFSINQVTGHNIKVALYSGTTEQNNITFDTTISASGVMRIHVPFDDASLVDLSFGTEYRLALAPQDSTNQTIYILEVETASDFAAWPCGTEFYLSTRTGGAWGDNPAKRPFFNLKFDDWSEPAAGGVNRSILPSGLSAMG